LEVSIAHCRNHGVRRPPLSWLRVHIQKSLNETFQIQYEINAKLPPDRKFEPVFWWFGTWEKFRPLQEELLPDSPRPRRLRRFRLTGFVLLTSGLLLLAVTLRR